MTQLNVDRSYSIEQMRARLINNKSTAGQNGSEPLGQSFADILAQKKSLENQELKFSKHANERLHSRNIDLSESQRERLNHAVKAAEAKGIKESLVMMDNLAFIINVKNNTVVTAVTGGEEKIFSNIDGAVVV